MLPECRCGSRIDSGLLREVTAHPKAIQRREDLLYRIAFGESRKDRVDLVSAVQQGRNGRVDGVRYPRLPAFREQKEPAIRADYGLDTGLEAWAGRRFRVHADYPRSTAGGRKRINVVPKLFGYIVGR